MSVRVITSPAAVVDLATAKQHLVVTHDLDNALIGAYVAAATGHIDGPDGWLGRAIGVQTLELRIDDFRGDGYGLIQLPYPPLIDVMSVIYLDSDGVEQTVDPALYDLVAGPALRPAFNQVWPSPRTISEAVRIRYRAGYVADASADPLVAACPAPLTAAILLMAGDLYANREPTTAGPASALPMSVTVERLLAPFRVWSI